MKSINTTSTGALLLCGFTALASSSIDYGNLDLFTGQELYAIELKYNPELPKTRIDEYVKTTYNFKEKISNLNSLEYNFIELTHKFSIEQIELESDFTNALNDLFLSKKGNKPSKQRF